MHSFTRMGIRIFGIYHCLMALVCLAITIFAVAYVFLPERTATSLLASLIGLALTPLYLATGIGLINRRPWARIDGIILGFIGVGLVLLVLLAALIPVLHILPLTRRILVALAGMLALYAILAMLDVGAILFLTSPRSKAAFSGAPYPVAWPDALSPLELMLHSFFRVSLE
jgi:hypothetical protein